MLAGIIVVVIFFGSLYLIFTEKLNRTITALAGSMLTIVVGRVMGFYSEEQAIEAIDFNTLGLLLGMAAIGFVLGVVGQAAGWW